MFLLDITSNKVVHLSSIDNLLIEIITTNFFTRKQKRRADRHSFQSSISNITISSSIKKAKQNKAEASKIEESFWNDIDEKTKDEREIIENGGYGTISRDYGISPVVRYADYTKIWGHLGRFRAYGAYEIAENGNNVSMENEESTRQMVSKETMERAAKHFKYFVRGEILGDIGFVPSFGLNIDSGEWEKYRLMSMMSIYRPLLALKRATA